MEERIKVLVVEDDIGIRQTLMETLTALGFLVGEANTGEESLERLRMVNYHAVLLDINMPGMGGLETCRRIFMSYPRLPIIMLTVRDDEDDKVNALEAGAHDYVTKPFQMRELTARLRAAIRSTGIAASSSDLRITIGDIVLNRGSYRVEKRGVQVRLTPKEFELLHYLMKSAGRPIPHKRLLIEIWGSEHGDEREYLRVLINQLRKKIEDEPTKPTYILTESHVGYRFRDS
jgi:two-component system, OmpR family, KDP operon response regulator KdpE